MNDRISYLKLGIIGALLDHVAFVVDLSALFRVKASFVEQKSTFLAAFHRFYEGLVPPNREHFARAQRREDIAVVRGIDEVIVLRLLSEGLAVFVIKFTFSGH